MGQRAVWIDQDEARIFHVEGTAFDETTIHAPHHHIHRHSKDHESKAHNHPAEETRYFEAVLTALKGTEQLLLMGPSVTKLHFLRYIEKNGPAVAATVVGMETASHPSDRQLVAHVRHYFHNDPPRLGHPSRPTS